jgi:pyridoxine 5-phosphate synthase
MKMVTQGKNEKQKYPEIRLSVNVDHVASLREARKEKEPDPVHAAVLAKIGGADGITVHLRKDRRHIKERDVKMIKEAVDLPLTVEMGLFEDILDFVLEVKPAKVTLVPERQGEVTTEGGMDLKPEGTKNEVEKFAKALQEKGIKVGAFIDGDEKTVEIAKEIGLDFVEINTTQYAKDPQNFKIVKKIEEVAKYASEKGLEVMAGHALSVANVSKIAQIIYIEELSIGFSIVARAVFVGFERAVREMKDEMMRSRFLAISSMDNFKIS